MKSAPRSVWIDVSEGIIEKEYTGYTSADERGHHMCSCTYKGNGIVWPWNEEKHAVKNVTQLERRATFEEQEQWYKNQFTLDNKTMLNLMGLFNDMYDVGDAFHEMWNAWVGTDFYEMAANLSDEDFILVGIAPATWDKDDIFGEGNSCAYVAEYEDGTRFWCHGSKRWVEDMREQMRDTYAQVMAKS